MEISKVEEIFKDCLENDTEDDILRPCKFTYEDFGNLLMLTCSSYRLSPNLRVVMGEQGQVVITYNKENNGTIKVYAGFNVNNWPICVESNAKFAKTIFGEGTKFSIDYSDGRSQNSVTATETNVDENLKASFTKICAALMFVIGA